MFAAQFVHPSSGDNIMETSDLHTWKFWPDEDDMDRANPVRAWFKSGYTGSGVASPLFEAETEIEAINLANNWMHNEVQSDMAA